MSDKVYRFPIFKKGVWGQGCFCWIKHLPIKDIWSLTILWQLTVFQFFKGSKGYPQSHESSWAMRCNCYQRTHLITLTLKSVTQKKISKNKKKYNITDITNKFVLVEIYLLISLTSMLYLLKTAGQNASLHRTKSSSKLRK